MYIHMCNAYKIANTLAYIAVVRALESVNDMALQECQQTPKSL